MVKTRYESGAVSLFAVIFATLLLTVLTIGFVKLMVRDQEQATNNDLSQSAYDSALAGVEDAKRVVRACNQNNSVACRELIKPDDCKVIARAGIAGDMHKNETIIQSSRRNGAAYDQAYTCVNISMDTPDYLYDAVEHESKLVPLKATGDVSSVSIEWYSRKDAGEGNSASMPPATRGLAYFPPKSSWGGSAPPTIRAQVITPGENFTLESLDGTAASQTVFLRPGSISDNGTVNTISLSGQSRATDGEEHNNSASLVSGCTKGFLHNGYSCKTVLQLPTTLSREASKNAFIRITPIYKNAAVRVAMQSGDGSSVKFYGVQPAVDSTGRASNLFRRVEARLQLGDNFPYPTNAVDLRGNLCKDFSVTNKRVIRGRCNP